MAMASDNHHHQQKLEAWGPTQVACDSKSPPLHPLSCKLSAYVAIQILLLDNHVENNESIDFDVVREKIYADVKELFQVGFRLQCIAHLVAPPDVIFA